MYALFLIVFRMFQGFFTAICEPELIEEPVCAGIFHIFRVGECPRTLLPFHDGSKLLPNGLVFLPANTSLPRAL